MPYMNDSHQNKKGIKRIIVFLSAFIVLLLVSMLCYFGSYYHGTERAEAAMNSIGEYSADGVTVKKTETGWLFDGPGDKYAFIFYPGAKVEAKAYAALMRSVAEKGADCFLCNMPLNFALLDIDRADKILCEYKYDHWFIGGHSLGGVAAAIFCEEEGERFSGLILLASYSSEKIDEPEVLCISGTEDKVLNRDNYHKAVSEKRYPDNSTEVVIQGGNHAQFGDYGEQKGDGTAVVSAEVQQNQTADAIIEMINNK